MRNFKRLAAMVSAVSLAACAVAPVAALAVDGDDEIRSDVSTVIEKGNITISTDESDHEYQCYQIFKADLSKDSENNVILANVKWGSATGNTEVLTGKICKALFDLNIKDENDNNIFSKVNSEGARVQLTAANEVAEALSKISSNNDLTSYADIDKVAKAIKDNCVDTKTSLVQQKDESGKVTGYKAENLAPGYYLIVDEATKLGDDEAYTKYILQVADTDVTVAPKADAPNVMKKVYEDSKSADEEKVSFAGKDEFALGNGFNDVADYSIGEEIKFELFGTLPSTFANYEGYYYKFTDTMGNGLTLRDSSEDNKVDGNDFIVTVIEENKTVILNTSQYTYAETNNGFTIEIANLKAIDMDTETEGIQTMTKDAIIKVEYSASLNENAVIGNLGNPNDVYLTYSNNSNTAHGGNNDETSDTNKDYTVVFTYELDVTKYLGDKADDKKADANNGTKAGFKLRNAEGKYAELDANNKFKMWSENGTEVFTSANGTFEFKGIQDGTYTLVETTVPIGYNKMEDKEIVILADTSNTTLGTCQDYGEVSAHENGKVLTSLKLDSTETNDENKGIVALDIENKKGTGLPSTGGIGTTIFYVGGGAMVAVAGVFLITKKRMGKKDE